ncbi:cupin domain-containing protein [Noviherbaspirillum aridicola]|uniref:Phosphoribosylaminoimidazole carboxylase n=1 Tax=Noviherbaspirillum aridicola TaxID=2849687 RepID=A0ABQ4Q4C1_9BURK|nr:cupin domain-containing protein [Noviherbaspirillum aridicola]GIZ51851.1 phosphoribosylaminoimidazole carboxylase [Noviherbaspirillum aridicola]
MNETRLPNLYAGLPPPAAEEFFETLAAGGDTRIERIVSHGHCSPPGFWYDQPRHEWVTLLRGEAVLRFERDGRTLRLGEGDHVNIPAGCRHRVEWTAPDRETVWLAVFY